MHDAANTGYSPCDNVPDDCDAVNTSSALGIDIIGTINPVVFKNSSGHKKILVMTGYAGFEEPAGTDHVNLTCLDWYNGQLNVDWNYTLPRTTISSGYYSNSWSSAATDGTYAYATSDNKIVCVNVLTGVEVWNFTMIKDSCNGGPTIGGQYVFGSDWGNGGGGNYYCLYKNNGTLKWIFNSSCASYDFGYAQATPAYENDDGDEYIYVTGYTYSGPADTGVLCKIGVSDGSEDWGVSIDNDYFCGSPSIDDDYVFVTSYTFSGAYGDLYQYDKDGNLIDSEEIEKTDATPSIDKASNRVYVSGGWNGGPWGATPPGVRSYGYSSGGLNLAWNRINQGIGGWTCSVALADEDEEGHQIAFAGKETGNINYPSFCYNTTYALYDGNFGATSWDYPAGGATAAIAWDEVYTIDHTGDLYIFSP